MESAKLMFAKLEPLDRNKHAALKFKPAKDYRFADKQSHAPVSLAELAEAAHYFPIVFPAGGEGVRVVPQALFSLVQGENAYVDEQGQWTAPYVPAHIRRYPFILAMMDEKSDQYAVMIDVEAPQFQAPDGEPIFVKSETSDELVPSKTVESAREFLGRFHGEIVSTTKLLSALEEKDLLVSRQVEIKLGEKRVVLSGFRTVDEDKLRQLDDATSGNWVRNGLMNVIYTHIHSLGNVRELAKLQPHALIEA